MTSQAVRAYGQPMPCTRSVARSVSMRSFTTAQQTRRVNTGQQTYSISIERYHNHAWVQVTRFRDRELPAQPSASSLRIRPIPPSRMAVHLSSLRCEPHPCPLAWNDVGERRSKRLQPCRPRHRRLPVEGSSDRGVSRDVDGEPSTVPMVLCADPAHGDRPASNDKIFHSRSGHGVTPNRTEVPRENGETRCPHLRGKPRSQLPLLSRVSRAGSTCSCGDSLRRSVSYGAPLECAKQSARKPKGFRGYSMLGRRWALKYWTLSVWEDEATFAGIRRRASTCRRRCRRSLLIWRQRDSSVGKVRARRCRLHGPKRCDGSRTPRSS